MAVGEATVISLSGSLDRASAAALFEPIDEALRRQRLHLVLDLHRLPYLDEDALDVLSTALRNVSEFGGTLAAAGVGPSLRPAVDSLVPLGMRVHMSVLAAIVEGKQENATP